MAALNPPTKKNHRANNRPKFNSALNLFKMGFCQIWQHGRKSEFVKNTTLHSHLFLQMIQEPSAWQPVLKLDLMNG